MAVEQYLKEIAVCHSPAFERKRNLDEKSRFSDRTKQNLFYSNLRLSVNIAKKYRFYDELSDLIQEGNIGLMRAVDKFDASQRNKFATYAPYWIKSFITRGISKNQK